MLPRLNTQKAASILKGFCITTTALMFNANQVVANFAKFSFS
jgi:hypothetical protein